uniref:WW domain binding protein VOPP1 n=1 Tax=Sinocyclocheilus rhinocerous TaxID=307959 RepID=A0A673GYA7_9TELE
MQMNPVDYFCTHETLFIKLSLHLQTVAEKKYCWYFEGDYPVYFVCKTYEDCCGTQCCVRALSVQRIWYFWLLLIIGILCCCSTGYFIRRRVHPYPPPEGPDFNVSFTRHPIIAPGNLFLRTRLAYSAHVVSSAVCMSSLCVGRIASGWLSQLWRLRDCSHLHRLPSADTPRSRDCSVFSPAVLLQPAPSFL